MSVLIRFKKQEVMEELIKSADEVPISKSRFYYLLKKYHKKMFPTTKIRNSASTMRKKKIPTLSQ